jgi:hypothetical protein
MEQLSGTTHTAKRSATLVLLEPHKRESSQWLKFRDFQPKVAEGTRLKDLMRFSMPFKTEGIRFFVL